MDIISAIMDIEQKVGRINDASDELAVQYEKKLKTELEGKERAYSEKIEKFKENTKTSCHEGKNKRAAEIRKSYNKKLEETEKKCEENKEIWIDEIVGRVIRN